MLPFALTQGLAIKMPYGMEQDIAWRDVGKSFNTTLSIENVGCVT